MIDSGHIPVMLNEVLDALSPKDGEVYVDGTLGGGGYTRAILEAADCRVIAFDRDPDAIKNAQTWGDVYGDRLVLKNHPFAEIKEVLDGISVQGVVFDLGVSSMQLDQAERGFSFRADGPLSMRMDQGKPDASDLVNMASKEDLSGIMKVYGEERFASRIAGAIVRARENGRIETTNQLSAIIERAAPKNPKSKIHAATRAFQAFRIFVNNELGQLNDALAAVEHVVEADARLVVVTFHSLEDRVVKKFLTARSGRLGQPSRHTPLAVTKPPSFSLSTTKAISASDDEIEINPRSRSAKLRAATRTEAMPWPPEKNEFVPRIDVSDTLNAWRC